jgi:hypothetical protein
MTSLIVATFEHFDMTVAKVVRSDAASNKLEKEAAEAAAAAADRSNSFRSIPLAVAKKRPVPAPSWTPFP